MLNNKVCEPTDSHLEFVATLLSSISSLNNNLGTMTGVKSITSMSTIDLASQGELEQDGEPCASEEHGIHGQERFVCILGSILWG